MATDADLRIALATDALKAFEDEYAELCDTWKLLDAKAQGTITVCGVFLAGTLAFVRGIESTTCDTERYILTVAVALLTTCVAFALFVLRVREVSRAPLGTERKQLVEDLIENRTSPKDRQIRFLFDQISMWEATNDEVNDVLGKKSTFLAIAQSLLMLAIVCASAIAMMEVW